MTTFRETAEYTKAMAYIRSQFPSKTATQIIIDSVVYTSNRLMVANSLQKEFKYDM